MARNLIGSTVPHLPQHDLLVTDLGPQTVISLWETAWTLPIKHGVIWWFGPLFLTHSPRILIINSHRFTLCNKLQLICRHIFAVKIQRYRVINKRTVMVVVVALHKESNIIIIMILFLSEKIRLTRIAHVISLLSMSNNYEPTLTMTICQAFMASLIY